MSEKKTSLLEKLKICAYFLKNDKFNNGILVRCDICNSTNIRIDKSETENLTTESEYTCLNCGGNCVAHQEWH